VAVAVILELSCLFWLDYFLTRSIVLQHRSFGYEVFDYGGSIELNPTQETKVENGEVRRVARDYVLFVMFYCLLAVFSRDLLLFFAGTYIYLVTFALLSQSFHLVKLQGVKSGGITGRLIYGREYVIRSTVWAFWAYLVLVSVVRPALDLYTLGGLCGGVAMTIIILSGRRT
jgi:hypothetical protein